jgi:hypothetical protein
MFPASAATSFQALSATLLPLSLEAAAARIHSAHTPAPLVTKSPNGQHPKVPLDNLSEVFTATAKESFNCRAQMLSSFASQVLAA